MTAASERVRASFDAQGLMATLGARLTELAPGEVRIEMAASPAVTQQHGFAHAGAVTSILDTACGYAAMTVAPPGTEVVTAEFKVNLVRPAVGHRFVAIGKVVKAGRTLTVCTGEVLSVSESGRSDTVVAIMQATIFNTPGGPPSATAPA